MMKRIEFYTFNNDIWYVKDGEHYKLTQDDELVSSMLSIIENFYSKAYRALDKEYSKITDLNDRQYRMVLRFIKCNFGEIDNVYDIQNTGKFVFECVKCPLRGECKYEGIICQPEFDSELSKREKEVLRLVYEGVQVQDIAEKLYLSPHTVKNHIRNAYSRLGVHSTSEFIIYANEHQLYDDDRIE